MMGATQHVHRMNEHRRQLSNQDMKFSMYAHVYCYYQQT